MVLRNIVLQVTETYAEAFIHQPNTASFAWCGLGNIPLSLKKTWTRLFSLLLSLLCFTPINGQFISELPKLNPSYYETFEQLKSYPSMCFDNAFQDNNGKLWLTTCSGSRQTGVALFQFDGYEFIVVKNALDSLNIHTSFP